MASRIFYSPSTGNTEQLSKGHESGRAASSWIILVIICGIILSVIAVSPLAGATCLESGSLLLDPTTAEAVLPVPLVDPWLVEGPVSEFNAVDLTMTVIGFTYQVPSLDFIIETGKLNPLENPIFSNMGDDLGASGGLTTLVGGTVIAIGRTEFRAGTVAGETCAVFIAESIYYEKAENVLEGLLTEVITADSSFKVGGTTIKMNTDPRLPSSITNAGGQTITVQDLIGSEGTIVSAGGYFDSIQGILVGNLVETEVLPIPAPGATDSVVITRVRSRRDRGELRVKGTVLPAPGTTIVTVIDLWIGAIDQAGTACAGEVLQNGVLVDPVSGIFSFRRRGIPQAFFPDTVCAISPNGGIFERAVP